MVSNLVQFGLLSATIFLLGDSHSVEKRQSRECQQKYFPVKECISKLITEGMSLLNLVKENKDSQAKSLHGQYKDNLDACIRRTAELEQCCEWDEEVCRLLEQQMALFESTANTLDNEMKALRRKTFTNFFA